MEILNQLGSLILGAVPTMILFILLVVAYSVLVRRPLEKTLAERRARTTGAVDQARGAISAAEAQTAVYEDKLRAARSEVLADRERRLQQRHAEREASLAAARQHAQERVQQAKTEIEGSLEAARRQIESAVEDLGQRIVGAILPSRAETSGVQQ